VGNIRVMIIDDSALVREILTQGLNAAPGIEVVGTATDPFNARDLIPTLRPHVLTLDVEMPKMNGVEFLRRLMPQFPIPTVMVSALTTRGQKVTLDALAAGAVDFVAKPHSNDPQGLQRMIRDLQQKVRGAAQATVRAHQPRPRATPTPPVPASVLRTDKTIIIGASTGGTEAIREVITKFPANGPPVLITQHMPAGFTKIFADRLNDECAMTVREARHGEAITPGVILISPGENQTRVKRSPAGCHIDARPGEKVNGHCPSVDVLMSSAAQAYGAKAIGIILTGMGGDGAAGLKAMRDAGARTMAQDEASCVVFGMPRVAWKIGGAERLVPLAEMAGQTLALLRRNEVPA